MSFRNLFALDLNIGLLSTNLKIGICTGIATVAVFSGVFTIVVHMEDLNNKSKQISNFGQVLKLALGKTFEPVTKGYEALYKELKGYADVVIENPKVLYSWAHVDDLDFWKTGAKSLLSGISDIREEVKNIGSKLKEITQKNIGEEAIKVDHFKDGVTPKSLYTYALTRVFWCNIKPDESGKAQTPNNCKKDETNISKIHADIASYFREHLFGEKPPGASGATTGASGGGSS